MRAGQPLFMSYYQSSPAPTELSRELAEEICNEFGMSLADMVPEFKQANDYGKRICGPFSDASLTATHAGRYCDAVYLFRHYCSDRENESVCESREALRNEERAFGSRYGDRDFDN